MKKINPILIVENLQIEVKTDNRNVNKVSKEEEFLLTLIAQIIVEIILNEEL